MRNFMLNEFYYGNLWIDAKRKTSCATLIFVVPFYSLLTVYGMLYSCHFTYDSIELTRMMKPKQTWTISYAAMQTVDFFVIRRKWVGGNLLSLMVPYYNLQFRSCRAFKRQRTGRSKTGNRVSRHIFLCGSDTAFKRQPYLCP